MSDGPPVTTEARYDGAWVRVVIDRPKANVVTAEVMEGLRQVLADLPNTGGLKLLSIEGAGKHFSFGASVEEHLPGQIDTVLPMFHGMIRSLVEVPVATAAIVRGQCLGGGFEVAMACDVVFAAEDAMMGVPEIRLGVLPPVAAVLLPVRVGASRAAHAILTGESRPAPWWHTAGLVAHVASAAALDAAVDAWFVEQLAPKSAEALRHAVSATRGPVRLATGAPLAEVERGYLDGVMATHDAVEGVAAFLEKRSPKWSHT